jgi:hypothetical protein
MPFTKDDFILCLEARTQDSGIGRFRDETPYSVDGNQARNSTANVLVVAKMDENQELVFIPGIDNSDPLNALTWLFNTTPNAGGTIKDGAYRAFYFIISPWVNNVNYQQQILDVDNVVTQYADIVYHAASESFYKAIQVSGPASTFYEPDVTVGWEAFWEVITDFSPEILNDQLIIHIHDDIVPFAFEDCLKDELVEIADDILCGVCDKWDDLLKPVKMALLLDAANSENWQNKATRAEVILLEGTKKFCC